MKLVKLVILLICLLNMNAWATPPVFNNLKKQQIQKILNTWRARSGIPSATLSILLPSQINPVTFTSGGVAYVNGVKPRGVTLFQAGSITKSFTSTIVLQLEAENKLNINDPITKYLPQYYRWNNVTIKQLLNHTSGIFNYTETGAFNRIRIYNPQAEFTPEQIVRLASEHRDYFPAGQGWKYSNTNYVLAGMIIQKVMGKSVENVMNHYLHDGLKFHLTNTFYLARLYTTAFIAKMARGYSCEGRDVTSGNMSWANTAGAIVTTTDDLLIWWRSLFQNKILPPQQMAQMMSLVCEGTSPLCSPGRNMSHLYGSEVGKGYGLGIIQSAYGSSRVGPVWWHNGSTKGYKAIVMWYPQSNIYLALTINRDPGYLLKPNLAAIQRVLNVLITNPPALVTYKKRVKQFFQRQSLFSAALKQY